VHEDVMHLAADSGPLLKVSGVAAARERFSSLDLEFASGVLCLRCDDDTDEIIVTASQRPVDSPGVSHPAISDLTGLSIEYAWSLTNHRGYVDGFQLRLTDGLGREETRQFEVGASAIDVRRVSD
jgi:hypothetical protein